MEGQDTITGHAGFAHERRTGEDIVVLTGYWTLRGLGDRIPALARALKPYAARSEVHWDLTRLAAVDSVGALVLRRIHHEQRPAHWAIRPEHAALFRRWYGVEIPAQPPRRLPPLPLQVATRYARGALDQSRAVITLIGQFVLDTGAILRDPIHAPWADISATIYESGARALGITALVGSLVGIVMSYLSALELRAFGAPSYIVNILGISILRELGPLLAAILVAGRSGSAMTAELGVMSVTEELDALAAMGVSRSMRLVLPKIVALAIVVPLLVAWTDIIGLTAGMITAHLILGVGIKDFLLSIPGSVPVINPVLGLIKGVVFGVVIAVVASHFGLRVKPNTQSLAEETTNSVVTSITMMIFVDAMFAIAFRSVGLP
ncbi:MAG: ABC transporter permease [Gammaproteobacteria bacterium]|nr:ABC transporter permease [Gammaproteobacteria bacterium]